MKTHIKIDTKYTKSYKTFEVAEKAAEKFLLELDHAIKEVKINPRFIISATEDGRFSPVFTNTGSFSIWFAQKGFAVIG